MTAAAISPAPDSCVSASGRLFITNLIAPPASLFWELLRYSDVPTRTPAQATRGERSPHYEAFANWLRLNLEQQVADLELLLDEQGWAERDLLIGWLKSEGHTALLPGEAAPAERWLFLSDLKIVLELIS